MKNLRTWSSRSVLGLMAASIIVLIFLAAGPRAAFLLAVGLGFGLVLEGFRFGFAGPWRVFVTERDGRGLLAQFLAIALTVIVAFPLLSRFPGELTGAYAPVGLAMIVAAFVFGVAMQLVMGCGSGTLVNAGSGNLVSFLALLGFIAGSFWGSLHISWWTSIGSLPTYSLQDLLGATGGMWVTLGGLGVLSLIAMSKAEYGKRKPPPRLLWAALFLAVLSILNLVIAGQPWGVVYGLGLWGAKLAQAGGMDVAVTGFWSSAAHAERLQQSLLTDVTSLTNIGIITGAFVVMGWRRGHQPQAVNLNLASWVVVLLAGIVLGYSARVAFGCNVGAYFSGISTGSLHGWAWFVAAFSGSIVGIKLRPLVIRPSVSVNPVLQTGIP